jgi:Rieske Fe-S protein
MIWFSCPFGNMNMPDGVTARREFTKLLALGPLASFGLIVAAAARKLWMSVTPGYAASVPVANINEVPVGSYKLFRYPTEDDPCILLRLGPDQFVAFNQNCTHLSCPVHFNSDTAQLECPCHLGSFSARDGRALAGPPKQPLAAISVTIREGKVWAAGG